MRSGCSEYLLKTVGKEQLLNAVARVGGRRRERTQPFRAQVLAFMGAKGGCGVTSLVTQLGALLANSFSKKTLVVDLHPDFGDAALYLGLTKYRYHFFELVENNDRLDAELLQSFLAHHSSGLELIPAPEGNDAPRRILPGAVAQTFDFLRMRYDYILVDMAPGLSDENLEMIRHCDQLQVVTVAEVSALRNVVRHFDYLTRKEIPRERFRVVLNRHQKRALISDSEIETLSPLRLPMIKKPLAITYGTAELPPLVADSRQLHARRAAEHLPGALIPVAGADHFTITHELRDRDGELTRQLLLLLD
jgi:pilus assembly protein CpaE